MTEQRAANPAPVPLAGGTTFVGAAGAIAGTVADQTGGVIEDAEVTATNSATNSVYTARTDTVGAYLLRNLPPGSYFVQVSFTGFMTLSITRVPVQTVSVTQLDATLSPGAQTQTVMIVADLPMVNTTSASLAGRNFMNLLELSPGAAAPPQLSTPRLREYFPETLFWQPELVTDAGGRARLTIPLADNITTWKLSVIASTEDGLIGVVDKDIRAFQPFFLDHDPPRFLTVGDEITLPVPLRNYLDRGLQLDLSMKPEKWFAPLGPLEARAEMKSGETQNKTFAFRALAPVEDGKSRITATGLAAGDAIERNVTVRPNGELITRTASQVFNQTASLDVNIPGTALAAPLTGTLKIYPNLAAHVLESLENIFPGPTAAPSKRSLPRIRVFSFCAAPRRRAWNPLQRRRKPFATFKSPTSNCSPIARPMGASPTGAAETPIQL